MAVSTNIDMNSFQDLNLFSNTSVNYGSYTSYAIAFGNSAGNTSQAEYQGAAFLIPKQVPLTTFTDPIKDLLLNISAVPGNSIIAPVYLGSNPNVAVFTQGTGQYSVIGVRSVADYNELFGNLYVDTPDTSLTPFVLTANVNDQFGNTRSWTSNVTLTVNPGFTITGNLTYDEDTRRGITNITLQDPGGTATPSYNLTFSTANANVGMVQYDSGVVTDPANVVITKQVARSGLQVQIDSGFFKFIPAADYTGNTQVQYVQQRSDDGRTWVGNINLNIGNTHSNYAVPANISYDQNKLANISTISITDLRPNNINANIQYVSTVASANTQVGYLRYQSVDYSTLTIGPDIKANVNSALANVVFVSGADYSGNANTTITYSQLQSTDNVQQATNVPIPVRLGNLAPTFYSLGGNITMAENNLGNLGTFSINDIRPNNVDANIQYEVTFTDTGTGNLVYANVASNPLVLTGTKTALNTIMTTPNIKYRPALDFDGSTTIRYRQQQLTDNIVQANLVGSTVTVTNVTPYSLPSGNIYFYQGTAGDLLTGLAVTDNAGNAYPSTTYTVTVDTQDSTKLQVSYLGNVANSHSWTGTKAEVNAILANVRPMPVTDFMANGGLNYSQSRTIPGVGTVTQANAVGITVLGVATNLSRVVKNYQGRTSTAVLAGSGIINQGYTGSNAFLYLTSATGFFRLGTSEYPGGITIGPTTISALNTNLNNDIYYVPANNASANTTYNIRINRNGANVIDYTGTLTFTGNASYSRLNTFTSETGTFALSYDEIRFGTVSLLLVGSGAGGYATDWGQNQGPGGGGGSVKEIATLASYANVVAGSYDYYVGRGGTGGDYGTIVPEAGYQSFVRTPNGYILDLVFGGDIGNISTGAGGNGGSPNGGRGGNSFSGGANAAGQGGVFSTFSGANLSYGGGGGAGRTQNTTIPTPYAGYGTSGGTGGAARQDAYYGFPGNVIMAVDGVRGGGGGGAGVGAFGPPFTRTLGGDGGDGIIILKVS